MPTNFATLLQAGFIVDQKLLKDFSAGLINKYTPKEDPLDPDSPDKEAIIYRLTCMTLF